MGFVVRMDGDVEGLIPGNSFKFNGLVFLWGMDVGECHLYT